MPIEHYQRTFPFSAIAAMHPALFYDDCNGTWNWKRTIFGTAPLYEYDPTAALVGLNGILLQTGATEPTTNDLISIYRDFWLPPLEQLRLQTCFNLVADSPAATLSFILHWFTGVNHYVGGVQVQADNGAIRYASAVAAGAITWTACPDCTCQNADDSWNKLDFSIDLKALTYHRGNVNEYVLDLSQLAIPSEGSGIPKYLQLNFLLQTLADAQATAYIDQVLLTPENP